MFGPFHGYMAYHDARDRMPRDVLKCMAGRLRAVEEGLDVPTAYCWWRLDKLELPKVMLWELEQAGYLHVHELVRGMRHLERYDLALFNASRVLLDAIARPADSHLSVAQLVGLTRLSGYPRYAFDAFGRLLRVDVGEDDAEWRFRLDEAEDGSDPFAVTPVWRMPLHHRFKDSLVRRGCRTVGVAMMLTDDELRAMDCCGDKGLGRLREMAQEVAWAEEDSWDAVREGAALAYRKCLRRCYPLYPEPFRASMPLALMEEAGPGLTAEDYRDAAVAMVESDERLPSELAGVLSRGVADYRRWLHPNWYPARVRRPKGPAWPGVFRAQTDADGACVLTDHGRVLEVHHPRVSDWLDAHVPEGDARDLVMSRLESPLPWDDWDSWIRADCLLSRHLGRERTLVVEENVYRHFYEHYARSVEEFCQLTGQPASTADFLEREPPTMHSRKRDLELAASDPLVPRHVRKAVATHVRELRRLEERTRVSGS